MKNITGKTNNQLNETEIEARNQYQKEIYLKNKKKILARRKELYYLKHKKNKQEYYLKNQNDISKKQEQYRALNKDKFLAQQRQYQQNNKERIQIMQKKRYEKNKKHINEVHRIYHNKKYNQDPQFKIKTNARAILNKFLSLGYQEKLVTWLTSSSSGQAFIQHIESQFEPGMSWANRKEWHLDHVKPVTSFDLTNLSELRQCYYYKNLKPVWAKNNLNKAGSIS